MNDVIVSIPKKINYIDLLIYTTFLFPIFTATLDNDIINKVLFGTLFVQFFLVVIFHGISRSSICILILFSINLFFAAIFTDWPMRYINLILYYPFFIFYSIFAIDFKEEILQFFKTNKTIVLFVIRLWTVLIGFSIFLPSSYYVKEAGASYFGSYTGSIFRFAPTAIFIIGLTMISMTLYKRKWDIIYNLVPLYAFFMGSSRTYLVIGLCLFVVQWFWFLGSKKKFYLSLVPMVAIVLVLVFATSIGDKILHTFDDSNYGDFWFRITSSRSLVWANMIELWQEGSVINKIFGSGIEFSFDNFGLWAHNDFIELTLAFGLWGATQYIAVMLALQKKYFTTKNKVPLIVVVCVFTVWFFNAFFNMHYTYFCASLAFPVVLSAVSAHYDNNEV